MRAFLLRALLHEELRSSPRSRSATNGLLTRAWRWCPASIASCGAVNVVCAAAEGKRSCDPRPLRRQVPPPAIRWWTKTVDWLRWGRQGVHPGHNAARITAFVKAKIYGSRRGQSAWLTLAPAAGREYTLNVRDLLADVEQGHEEIPRGTNWRRTPLPEFTRKAQETLEKIQKTRTSPWACAIARFRQCPTPGPMARPSGFRRHLPQRCWRTMHGHQRGWRPGTSPGSRRRTVSRSRPTLRRRMRLHHGQARQKEVAFALTTWALKVRGWPCARRFGRSVREQGRGGDHGHDLRYAPAPQDCAS